MAPTENVLLPELPRGRQKRRGPWEVQRAVVFALMVRDMKSRVGGQWVSFVWTVFEPLAHVLVLVWVFAVLRGVTRDHLEFPVFLVAGLVPFFFFQDIVTRMLDAVEASRGLFAYRQVKPLDALVARALVEALMVLIVYAVSLGVLGWLGYHVVPHDPLGLVLMNLLLFLFGISAGLYLTMLSHDRPRLRKVIRLTFMPLYMFSGVIFNVDSLPRPLIEPLLWNPLLHLVELARAAMISAYVPTQGINPWYPMAWIVGLACAGLLMYRAKQQLLMTTQG
jgi:capsular polysaccharide transport system permease protein